MRRSFAGSCRSGNPLPEPGSRSIERRGRDSNSRCACAHNGFRDGPSDVRAWLWKGSSRLPSAARQDVRQAGCWRLMAGAQRASPSREACAFQPAAGRLARGCPTNVNRLAASTSAPATSIAARMPETRSSRLLSGPAATAVAIDPRVARPSAVPTWRAVLRTPDATPACSTSTAPIATAEMAGAAAPKPTPTRR